MKRHMWNEDCVYHWKHFGGNLEMIPIFDAFSERLNTRKHITKLFVNGHHSVRRDRRIRTLISGRGARPQRQRLRGGIVGPWKRPCLGCLCGSCAIISSSIIPYAVGLSKSSAACGLFLSNSLSIYMQPCNGSPSRLLLFICIRTAGIYKNRETIRTEKRDCHFVWNYAERHLAPFVNRKVVYNCTDGPRITADNE